MNKPKIEDFIKNFKKNFNNYVEHIFLHGACYHFAVILNNLYDGEIFYDMIKGHFMFKYNDGFYDITGKIHVNENHCKNIEEIQKIDDAYYRHITRDCIFMEEKPYEEIE